MSIKCFNEPSGKLRLFLKFKIFNIFTMVLHFCNRIECHYLSDQYIAVMVGDVFRDFFTISGKQVRFSPKKVWTLFSGHEFSILMDVIFNRNHRLLIELIEGKMIYIFLGNLLKPIPQSNRGPPRINLHHAATIFSRASFRSEDFGSR